MVVISSPGYNSGALVEFIPPPGRPPSGLDRSRAAMGVMAKVQRVDVTPLQLTTMLEQARAELDRGQPAAARVYVQSALTRLETDRSHQDAVLDESARTADAPAPRVTPPLHDQASKPRT